MSKLELLKLTLTQDIQDLREELTKHQLSEGDEQDWGEYNETSGYYMGRIEQIRLILESLQ